MTTKQQILDEIKRTARENGGKPLGMGRFKQETGIKDYYWKKYWSRFGEAQREAGFEPNQLQGGYADEFLVGKVIGVMRKLGKFPTFGELGVEKNNDREFPNRNVFTKFGSKRNLALKIVNYCKEKGTYEDIINLCGPVLETHTIRDGSEKADVENMGEVYLFKSGRFYKIGRTADTVRRGTELRIQLPEKIDLIHSIKTDDPNGVEKYWHKRFDQKRMNGEWFDLNSADIKAFKRWTRIY